MKAFEYNFNPQTSGYFFDSFSFEPESGHEKSLGSLYMVGILSNAQQNDEFFLSNLAKKIRENHYQSKSKDLETALNESLQLANQHLEALVKSDCAGWINNLGFAVIGIKNRSINFTKTGPVRILLLRQGGVIDLEEGIDFPEMETCPLRVFGNLAIGKLEEGDAIMAATNGIADFLTKQKMDVDIAGLVAPENAEQKLDEKKLENLFSSHRTELGQVPGSCLIVSLRKNEAPEAAAGFLPAANLKKMALRDAFKPTSLSSPVNTPKLSLPSVPRLPLLKAGAIILVIAAIAAGGYLYLLNENQKKTRATSDAFYAIENKVAQAKGYQDGGQAVEASNLLQASLQELSVLESQASLTPELKEQVQELKAQIGDNMDSLNKVEETAAIEPLFDLKDSGIDPQKLLRFNGEFYFFDPKVQNIYYLDKNNSAKSVAGQVNFDSAAAGAESLLFFAKPNLFSYYSKGEFSKVITLKDPYAGYAYEDFYTYAQNLYLIDKNSGKIVKYPHLGGDSWALPQVWLNADPSKLAMFASMAFDKSAWILNKDGSVDKYYLGKLETTFKANYFPAPGQPAKIVTSLDNPNLYILDKNPPRIVVMDKNGTLLRQVKSSQFNDIRDIAVSDDGKNIWILNGTALYRVGAD
ncbi:MAG TPA: hypothetical protein P5080_01110 [Candidatus Paceibacterota bacterium]|nr:hypothetical protein [Candidatus Pacearchaeota archaeon]HRZ50572.1 hypothetical protein [Candidatus Paceibacterota bacterium]HSA36293.1 hypothetical protein [Candidatus Paceibacterota bacterium]